MRTDNDIALYTVELSILCTRAKIQGKLMLCSLSNIRVQRKERLESNLEQLQAPRTSSLLFAADAGTDCYKAPEQFLSGRRDGRKGDVWSLGAC